jgi:hypothetical protein
VRLETTDGRFLQEFFEATGTGGTFELRPQAPLPEAFRLVVMGGRLAGEPFTGRLVQVVRGLRAVDAPFFKPTIFTTLVAALEGRTGVERGTEEARLRAHLGIPPEAGDFTRHFSEARFMAEARGEVDGLVEAVAKAAAGSASEDRRFRPVVVRGLLGSLGKWFFGQAANGAASQAGSWGLGWVMDQFGVNPETNRFKELQGKIAEVKAAVEDLQREIGQLRLDMAEQFRLVVADLDRRSQRQDAQRSADVVMGLHTRMGDYLGANPSPELVDMLANQIIQDVDLELTHLDSLMMGSGSDPDFQGLIRMYADYAGRISADPTDAKTPLRRSWRYYMASFYQLGQVQVIGLNLLAEAYQHKKQPALARAAVERGRERLRRQCELFMDQYTRLVFKGGWKMQDFSACHEAFDRGFYQARSFEAPPPDQAYAKFYALNRADWLVSSLTANEHEGRLSVHLFTMAPPAGTSLDAVRLQVGSIPVVDGGGPLPVAVPGPEAASRVLVPDVDNRAGLPTLQALRTTFAMPDALVGEARRKWFLLDPNGSHPLLDGQGLLASSLRFTGPLSSQRNSTAFEGAFLTRVSDPAWADKAAEACTVLAFAWGPAEPPCYVLP